MVVCNTQRVAADCHMAAACCALRLLCHISHMCVRARVCACVRLSVQVLSKTQKEWMATGWDEGFINKFKSAWGGL
eukprot:COSAG05_NODE_1022_length_6130_cov_48.450174_7_plen_76_part_00